MGKNAWLIQVHELFRNNSRTFLVNSCLPGEPGSMIAGEGREVDTLSQECLFTVTPKMFYVPPKIRKHARSVNLKSLLQIFGSFGGRESYRFTEGEDQKSLHSWRHFHISGMSTHTFLLSISISLVAPMKYLQFHCSHRHQPLNCNIITIVIWYHGDLISSSS